MQDKELSQRLVKRVRINQFLDNFCVFNWSFFAISWIFSFFTILSCLMFITYSIEYQTDYYDILSKIQTDLIIMLNYFVSNILAVLNSFNHLNDLLFNGQRIFNFNVELLNEFSLNTQGYVLLVVSAIITLQLYVLSLYQYYIQRKIKSIGYMNYFVSFIFLFDFYKREKRKKIKIKLLDVLKLEPLNTKNKTQTDLVMQSFFKIQHKDLDKYKLVIKIQTIFGWYNYQVWEIVEVDSEEIDNNDEIVTNNDEDDESIVVVKQKQSKVLKKPNKDIIL